MHACTHTQTHTRAHTHRDTDTHTCTCTHTRTRTHTHNLLVPGCRGDTWTLRGKALGRKRIPQCVAGRRRAGQQEAVIHSEVPGPSQDQTHRGESAHRRGGGTQGHQLSEPPSAAAALSVQKPPGENLSRPSFRSAVCGPGPLCTGGLCSPGRGAGAARGRLRGARRPTGPIPMPRAKNGAPPGLGDWVSDTGWADRPAGSRTRPLHPVEASARGGPERIHHHPAPRVSVPVMRT